MEHDEHYDRALDEYVSETEQYRDDVEKYGE